MSNREALRKLSRKYPARPEIEKIIDGLASAPDISVAMIATSILEQTLEDLLIKKFKCKSERVINRAFLNRGPLGDFYSKIVIATAFGVITTPLADQLHSLLAIRNVFGHSKVPVDFNNTVIAKEIADLAMVQAMRRNEAASPVASQYGLVEMNNKQWFLLIARLTMIMFDGFGTHKGSADEALTDILDGKL